MKKKIFNLVLSIALATLGGGYNPAFADAVFDTVGATEVNENGFSLNLLLKANSGNAFDISVRPIEDALRSTDGSVAIPLSNVILNNMSEDIYLQFDTPSYLFKNVQESSITKNIMAKVQDCGLVPSGTYSLNLEVLQINSETNEQISSGVYNLLFYVPVVHKITTDEPNQSIKVVGNDALAVNRRVPSVKTQRFSITSNTPWVLLARISDTSDKPGDFYIRTVSASEDVTERIQEPEKLLDDRDIIVAKGNAVSGNCDIYVEYYIEGKDGRIIRPGSYSKNLKFILKENR